MSRIIASFVLLLAASFPLQAQSPYRASWSRDLPLLIASGGSYVLANELDRGRTELSAERAAALHPESINRFDRIATSRYSPAAKEASEAMMGVFSVAPFALMLDGRARSDWAILGLMYLETRAIAFYLPDVVKSRADRLRPFVYNDDLSYEEKVESNPGGSFFSTQSTTAFATAAFLATVFSDYHPHSRWKKHVWGGSLMAATAIGIARLESGVHYPSDLLVGAGVGMALGWGIPSLHRSSLGEVLSVVAASERGLALSVRVR